MNLGRVETCRHMRLAKVDPLLLRQSYIPRYSLRFERTAWPDDGTKALTE